MPPEPAILAFDTSAAHCAAALLSGGKVITRVDEMAKGQAEHLMPMLEEILSGQRLGWPDLDAIGVGTGPGNFTGIRISVAAARGLALGLQKPAIGVSTLEAQAYGLDGTILSCLDARRGRAYVQMLAANVEMPPPAIVEMTKDALTKDHDSLEPRVVGPISTEVAQITGYAPTSQTCSTIEGILRIAATRLWTTQDRPAPLYLRAADAAPPRDPAPVILA